MRNARMVIVFLIGCVIAVIGQWQIIEVIEPNWEAGLVTFTMGLFALFWAGAIWCAVLIWAVATQR